MSFRFKVLYVILTQRHFALHVCKFLKRIKNVASNSLHNQQIVNCVGSFFNENVTLICFLIKNDVTTRWNHHDICKDHQLTVIWYYDVGDWCMTTDDWAFLILFFNIGTKNHHLLKKANIRLVTIVTIKPPPGEVNFCRNSSILVVKQ